jgi:chloramphenicol-sensitive protein RarD
MKKGDIMDNKKNLGVFYAAASYTLWGILPIYWKLIVGVSSVEILAHRILWAFAFVFLIIAYNRQWAEIKSVLADKKQVFYVFISAIFITINWGLYIWSVNSNRILDASLGYYINPLFVVVIAVVFFKEKLDRFKIISLSLALIGVVIMTIQYGEFPWISILLAVTFGLYGAMKKLVKTSSITGLALETAVITPLTLIYLVFRQISGQGALGRAPLGIILLLIGAGVVTAVPLLLFAKGAKRIPLSTLGFCQYISPTMSLLLGVFVYKETFTTAHMISFCFIWGGLAIYSMSQLGLFSTRKSSSSDITA